MKRQVTEKLDLDGEAESKTRLRLWISLLRMTRKTESTLRENFRTHFETTLPRFDVLATLDRFPEGLKMGELSELLLVSNGSTTVVVDRLFQDGLVNRTAVPGDRRALMITPTRKGAEQFKKQAFEHENWIDQMLQEITVEQAKQIMKVLETPKKSPSN